MAYSANPFLNLNSAWLKGLTLRYAKLFVAVIPPETIAIQCVVCPRGGALMPSRTALKRLGTGANHYFQNEKYNPKLLEVIDRLFTANIFRTA